MAFGLFRETHGYVKRRARFIAAMDHYFKDVVEVNDFKNLEELMVSAYDTAQYVRSCSGLKDWCPRTSVGDIGNAVVDAADATTSGKTYALAYEVQKLETLSKVIYNYLRDKAFKAGYESERDKHEKTKGLTIYTPPSRRTM